VLVRVHRQDAGEGAIPEVKGYRVGEKFLVRKKSGERDFELL